MIVFIRHAESTFNQRGDKSRNVPLTLNGIKQSEKLNGEYDLVICSTMRRARETLDSSKIKYGNLIFTTLCREILDGNPINLYNGEKEKIETEENINQRIHDFRQLLENYRKKYAKICVISHNSFLRRFLRLQRVIKNCEEIVEI